MFTVDIELVDGTKRSPQFPTQREAVAYAGRMAQDSAVKRSEVKGLDALYDYNGKKLKPVSEMSFQELEDENIMANGPASRRKEVEAELKRLVKRNLYPDRR